MNGFLKTVPGAALRGVAAAYLGLALLKLVSAGGETPLLTRPNPVLEGLSYRQVLLLAAVLEGLCGALGWWGRTPAVRRGAVSWMTVALLGYRGALSWLGVGLPCSCLGPVATWLDWSVEMEAAATRWTLFALVIACALVWFPDPVRRGAGRPGVPASAGG